MKMKMVIGIGFALFPATLLLADLQRPVAVAAPVLPAGNAIVYENAFRAVAEADVAADEAWSACRSYGELRARQAHVGAALRKALGPMPAKCPLDARTVARVERDGYAVEKVIFAAEPNHHVTANLFLPDARKFPGRRAGLVIPCGHSLNGKGEPSYQRGALQAARRGFVALVYDPLDQGERRQSRRNAAVQGTQAHNAIGRRAELLGWSMARFRLRDGMRALDYLETRPEVDPTRLGVMGHSGGGTMTSWIMALDPRIRCAAPSGFLSTMRDVCREIGPQDAEQFVFGELAFGFNHLGHILLRAPSPVLLCSSHGDFFPITGTFGTAKRAAEVYARLGHPDGFRLSDTFGPHHRHESTRTFAVDWMDWKLQQGPAPRPMDYYRNLDYGFSEAQADIALGYWPKDLGDMRTNRWAASVTPTGSTLDLAGERTVYDLMADEATRQKAARGTLTPDVVRSVAGIRPAAEIGFTVRNGNCLVLDDATPVPLHVSGAGETVVYVADDGVVPSMPGRRVFAADMRGFGENGRLVHVFYGVRSADEELAVLAHLVGETLVGKRAEDIIAVAKHVGGRPKLVAKGRAAIPAAHAYYTARELFADIELVDPPSAWEALWTDDGQPGRFADIVRGAWAHYDWTDLTKTERTLFPLRGVYFATHFGNWYEKASDAEIAEYIAELKYWDCNYVSAWFDMHDFTGMDDPAAAPRLRLIKTIFGSCRKNGMASCLGSLANEAFKESPPALRADGRAGQNGYTHNLAGYYHVEICPSKPGGLEQILKSRREVLAAFADSPPDYFWSCPYDQGGCTCSNCAPWGANGYLRTAKSVAALVRQMFPRVKFSLSSWRFDAFGPKLGEWAGLCARQDEVRTWADMIVIDQNQLPLLEANPVLTYCPMVEISMDRMLPWGGFGANPRPKMLERLIRRHPKMAGTMPYSEGLYEDLNKVIGLALLSGKATTARAAVEQYAARYFGAGTEGLVAEAVDILEDNLGHDAYVVQDGRRFDFYSLAQIDPARTWTLECRLSRLNAVRAERALALLNAAEAKMSASAKKAWRWRVLKLRAELDVALGKGATVEALEPRFNELASIYRVGRDTAQCLVPPTRTYLRPGPEALRNGDL